MKKLLKTILTIILILAILLFLMRLISPREIDDIHPLQPCEREYIEKADILWVIPKLNNFPISENKTWCKEIIDLNKTLGMHGIYHSYHEFKYKINESELQEGIQIFEECFGYKPELFKPPYLRLTSENRNILKENNLTIKKYFNQNAHKVYHCENTGTFPNWFHDLF